MPRATAHLRLRLSEAGRPLSQKEYLLCPVVRFILPQNVEVTIKGKRYWVLNLE